MITIHVHKAGAFSAFGHDHEISAPITHGKVDFGAREVELSVRTATLQVRDENVSEKDRAEIQSTMLGPEVLDAARNPEIVFRSRNAEQVAPGSWRLSGDLTLHGETQPVTVQVRESGGHYIGNAAFKQTEFGIKPVKVAGGAIRVKDEVQIEFDIQLLE